MKKTDDFWVGDRIVRPSVGEIQLGIERIHLEPRSMEVLVALAGKAPEVALKQELIEEVWGEAFVTDEVLTHAVWDLRRAFGDQASNPEFIQTIPKKGYRLIAPVKDFEPTGVQEAGPERSSVSRPLLLGVVGVAVLIAASIWIGRLRSVETDPLLDQPPPIERASLSGRRPQQTALTVTLTPTQYTGEPALPAGRLNQLDSSLAALPEEIEMRKADSCSPPPGNEDEYCMTPQLQKNINGYEVSVHLKKTASSRTVYQVSDEIADLGDLQAAAGDLVDLVSTYLEVVRKWDVRDPDIEPWISFRDHDVRAVRDFLLGREMVLTGEPGARTPFESALAFEPNFVAPRVWRTPTLVGDENEETLATHKKVLLELYNGATSFEKAMIGWALALIDDNRPEQRRVLQVAFDQRPENRPVRIALAIAAFSLKNYDESWQLVEPLLEDKWCYPGLYPMAAECAFYQERPDNARVALELALDCDPVAPESYAFLHLLAIYEGDTEAEEQARKDLDARKKEVPRALQVEIPPIAERLAVLAENEGRKEIADRLREFED